MNRRRVREEVSHAEFGTFLQQHPGLQEKTQKFEDGERVIYIEVVSRPHLTWHKPRAYKENGKFFIVRD